MADVEIDGTIYSDVSSVVLAGADGEEVAFFLPALQAKTVTPTALGVTVTPDEGYTGLSGVTVEPVTAAVDDAIASEHILAGVTILGVPGGIETYAGADTVTPKAEAQVLATAGKLLPSDLVVQAVDFSSHVAFGTRTTAASAESFTVSGLPFRPSRLVCALMPSMANLPQNAAAAMAWSEEDAVAALSYYTGTLWSTASAVFTASEGSIQVTASGKLFPAGSYSYIAVG